MDVGQTLHSLSILLSHSHMHANRVKRWLTFVRFGAVCSVVDAVKNTE